MNMDLDQTIVHCDALLRHAVGDARYPDRQHTPLVALSREVVDTLLAAGCRNQAAVVAAALGDLPYSRHVWREQVRKAQKLITRQFFSAFHVFFYLILRFKDYIWFGKRY